MHSLDSQRVVAYASGERAATHPEAAESKVRRELRHECREEMKMPKVIATPKRLALAEIVELPEFFACTAAQKQWVRAYFTSLEVTGRADAVSATRISYPSVAQQNLASRACHIAANKKVKAILALAFHRPQLSSVLPDLDEAIKKSIASDLRNGGGLSVATQRMVQFYEKEVRMARAREAEDAQEKYAVGSIIEQGGKKYRIDATEVEETK